MSNHIRNIVNAQPGAPVTVAQAEEMKSKIQEALVEIRQAREYDEYTDMREAAQLETLEAKLKASLASINYFLATGEWPEGGVGNTHQNPNDAQILRDVQPGWNGDVTIDQAIPPGYGNIQSLVDDGQFEGFVYFHDNNGDGLVEAVLEASPTSLRIEGFNHGHDIVYVETYLDETGAEKKRFWIGREHVTDTRANVIVTAHNLQLGRLEGLAQNPDEGITIDFHRVYRINENGEEGVLNLFGSDLNDIIIGSQGKDTIKGLKGNDKLFGEGGVDTIYGDDGLWRDAQGNVLSTEAVRRELGLRTDLADGNDTIDGGAGRDILYGEGGVNYGFATDPKTGANSELQKVDIYDLPSQGSRPRNDQWYVEGQSQGWGDIHEIDDHTVEISEIGTDGNSELTLRMPAGYDYIYGEPTGSSDIRVTFVKHNANGTPQSFTVIVKGALLGRTGDLRSPFTLKIIGNGEANIIDFHNIDFGNNNFIVEGEEANDMILAPRNELNRLGLTVEDLLSERNRIRRTNVLEEHADNIEDNEGLEARVRGNLIEVARIRAEDEMSEPGTTWLNDQRIVQIDPTGFDNAYVMVEPGHPENLLVVLTQQSATGGAPTTLVYKIINYQNFQGNITNRGSLDFIELRPDNDPVTPTPGGNGGQPEERESGFGLIPLLVEEIDGRKFSGNFIDAGDGDDFVYHLQGDNVEGEESAVVGRYIAEGDLSPLPAQPQTAGNGGRVEDNDDRRTQEPPPREEP